MFVLPLNTLAGLLACVRARVCVCGGGGGGGGGERRRKCFTKAEIMLGCLMQVKRSSNIWVSNWSDLWP